MCSSEFGSSLDSQLDSLEGAGIGQNNDCRAGSGLRTYILKIHASSGQRGIRRLAVNFSKHFLVNVCDYDLMNENAVCMHQ